MSKPILCLDFDGVCHSYTSGWKGVDNIPDPPVPGLFKFLEQAFKHFRVAIYSSRSELHLGRDAMRRWFIVHGIEYYMYQVDPDDESNSPHTMTKLIVDNLEFPAHKPSAFVTLDDRAVTFTGVWPDVALLKQFQPWTKWNSLNEVKE